MIVHAVCRVFQRAWKCEMWCPGEYPCPQAGLELREPLVPASNQAGNGTLIEAAARQSPRLLCDLLHCSPLMSRSDQFFLKV
ncbi:hypothetical protein MA20_48500 [Bradyrhizobium japonicum]|uniref:Uncharacterized protein n=1 Tax=Bradyrhizobium japonicum TaxID=375 RepID=A0A0A3XHU4_BRAJP|nr:hypothetical protein MA20_48500 [Bradyrhizobium japonicum]